MLNKKLPSSGLLSRIYELERAGRISSNTILEAIDLVDAEVLEEIEAFQLENDINYELNKLHIEVRKKYLPYIHSVLPVLFINKKMQILFANMACENLFTGFFDLTGHYFVDVFGKSFKIEEIRQIHDTIVHGHNGYCWKGEVSIKSRSIASVQIKVYIFPAEAEKEEPAEFAVMFDDITEESKRVIRDLFLSILKCSQLKDNDTTNHIIRVNHYSKRLAEELFRSKNPKYNRIDADFIDNIGFLAAFHDVGKIGTPDDILNKKGPLSEEEWNSMRGHTVSGAYILTTYPNPMAREIALAHHERWDGSGYPHQRSGEMIPLAARIVSIADVYDALRMERSYKPAMDHNAAVRAIIESKESHFDPFLVDVFNSIEKTFEQIFEDNRDMKDENSQGTAD